MKKFNKIILIVIDSFGIGAMDDADKYNDEGANTFLHIDACMDPFRIPNLMRLGLGNLQAPKHAQTTQTIGVQCALCEQSVGKDTTTGHWEMMGLHTKTPFITFTDTGFPQELIEQLEKESGHIVIGNKSASGTEILKELGEEELASHSKKMIVYTSADSVLQICGHEQSMGLDELYRVCDIARKITMKPQWKVGRVIARPYVGEDKDHFERTPHRKDLSIDPFAPTVLDLLKENKKDVVAIGKISDIFNGNGITKAIHSDSSIQGMEQTIEEMKKNHCGLIFTNLVDFDAKWGHRRDPIGYGKELEAFDEKLGELLDQLEDDDLLIIAADHGNDPCHPGTDHTREKVPFLAYHKHMDHSKTLEEQKSFGVIGMTILENFGIQKNPDMIGVSLLDQLI